MIVVLMGVSGCGKSTVGAMLAEKLGWRFREGDDFHPPENVDKMSRGVALSDRDRMPWLVRIKREIDVCSSNGSNAIWACSALRERYRDLLAAGISDVRFVYLKGDRHTIRKRLAARRDHYMRSDMLDSQLASLEEPEDAVVADVRTPPRDIVTRIVNELGLLTNVQ